MIGDDTEFAVAVRALLDRPFLTRTDPVWPAVAAHGDELADYFEDACGWALRIDRRAGTARLAKRHRQPDPTRPLRKSNGRPMRRSGYGMLFLIAAELISRPMTTVGDLADNIAAATRADTTLPAFDPTVHSNRLGFVDALRWYVDAGFVDVTAGDLDRYSGGADDAVLTAEPARFAQLLATATPPSRLQADTTEEWIEALADEPRYQLVEDGRADVEAINRRARHMLGRALLDDPAVLLDDVDDDVRRYLMSGPGRARMRSAVERAGFVFEESRDVLVAVDPTGEASDASFGGNVDIITQVAVAVLDELLPNRDAVEPVAAVDVESFVEGLLAEDRQWAASYQPDGAATLASAALDVLAGFALVTRTDHHVAPTAAAGRFVTTIIDSRRPAEEQQ